MTPKPRILIVEDDKDIRFVTRMTLQTLGGYEVADCGSGAEALRVAGDFAPDLLLLDVMMPGMSGPDTLAALRRVPGLEAKPAIFLTARTQAREVEGYQWMGVADIIAKPFDPHELCRRVASALERAPAASAAAPREALLVEDDAGVRYLVKVILEQAGFRLEALGDAAVARARLRRAPPEIVILDLNMPLGNGIELLGELRTLPAWKAVPVLMLTARGDEAAVRRAQAAGAGDYLVKPFDPAELIARLGRLCPASPVTSSR